MQPTYLPWSGYFGLMSQVDLFILLDSVQFAKRSWQQRNYIKSIHGPQLLSVPVLSKGKRDQLIKDTLIDPTRNFQKSHLKTIEHSYSSCPFFSETMSALSPLLDSSISCLSALNTRLIKSIADLVDITTPLLFSSDLQAMGSKADLLCSLSLAVDATTYVTVPGSLPYLLESTAFTDAGIPVEVFDYEHPIYDQLGRDFTPYMSMIDLCFNQLGSAKSIVKQASTILPLDKYLLKMS